MARNPRFQLSPSKSDGESDMTPKALSKQEFARRLYQLMRKKNWSQSDLARAAFGTMKGSEGYTIPRRKDSVSGYLAGRVWPDPKSLEQMAKAFGISVEDLLPNTTMAAIDQGEPSLEIKQAAGHPDKVWVRVSQLVTLDQAVSIAQILQVKADVAGVKRK